jgi:hypothetical protein
MGQFGLGGEFIATSDFPTVDHGAQPLLDL